MASRAVPPSIRNPPAHACFVCRRKDGDTPLMLCDGGCGLLRHEGCEPKRRGGKRVREEVSFVVKQADEDVEDDEDEGEEAEIMVLEAVAVEWDDQSTSPPTAGGAWGHTTPTAKTASEAPECWRCERCAVVVGARVFARAEGAGFGTGFFWPGRVLARDPHGQVQIEWEPRLDDGPFCKPTATASGGSASESSSSATEGSSGAAAAESYEPTWVSERYVAMIDVPSSPDVLRRGKRALAIWRDGHGYMCEVVGSAGRGQVAVQFDDGLQYEAPVGDVRGLLDEPLFNPSRQQRQKLAEEYDPAVGSQRAATRKVCCSDADTCGPFQRTLQRLLRVWRAPGRASDCDVSAGPVEGVWVAANFLNAEEVRALRLIFAASHPWGLYNWGNVGLRAELNSVMQRIDYGLPEMTAEGVAAARSSVQPIGELQQQVISLLESRLREAFGSVAWGGVPTGGAPPPLAPNMMQMTRIAPATCLGNHYDRRDKWDEGIASIAWSDGEGFDKDPRGDPWRLQMQLGPAGPMQRTVSAQLPPGSAYILAGHAQGRTQVCDKRCVAHATCSCCWTHGIWNETSSHTRQSITLRVFDPDWGRHGGGGGY